MVLGVQLPQELALMLHSVACSITMQGSKKPEGCGQAGESRAGKGLIIETRLQMHNTDSACDALLCYVGLQHSQPYICACALPPGTGDLHAHVCDTVQAPLDTLQQQA